MEERGMESLRLLRESVVKCIVLGSANIFLHLLNLV